MNIYKVTTMEVVSNSSTRAVKWAGSMAGARAAKKELCTAHGLKLTGVEYKEVEVGSGKAGLLEFLNSDESRA